MGTLTAQEKKETTIYGVKSLPFEVKDVDMTKRIVTGFFNSINFFDSDWDVSLTGSYNKSINDRGPNSSAIAKIKHLKDHDFSKVVSRPEVLEEKTVNNITGLYFESKISESTVGTDLLINYQEKIIDNHSMGFMYTVITWLEKNTDAYKRVFDLLVNPEDAEDKPGLFAVGEYKIFEGSSVPFGANSLTPFLGVKGQEEKYKADLISKCALMRKALRGGKQSDEAMKEFEFQLLQVEQLIKDMKEPSLKDTVEPSNTLEPNLFDQFIHI